MLLDGFCIITNIGSRLYGNCGRVVGSFMKFIVAFASSFTKLSNLGQARLVPGWPLGDRLLVFMGDLANTTFGGS